MRRLAVLLLLAGAAEANTPSVDLTWTAPTQNTDGTPIPAAGPGAIIGYRISFGLCVNGALPANPRTTDVSVQLAATVTGIDASGLWCFGMQTLADSAAPNNISAMSGIATKAVLLSSPPNPPADLKVSATTIYQFVGTADKIVMLPVGTVPADTACDPLQYVMGYFLVPQKGVVVSWFGSVKPKAVFAVCS